MPSKYHVEMRSLDCLFPSKQWGLVCLSLIALAVSDCNAAFLDARIYLFNGILHWHGDDCDLTLPLSRPGLADSLCLVGNNVFVAMHHHDLGWQTLSARWGSV